MWSLLDADQPIPWADRPLVFRHKYRFWVQPYREEAVTRVSRSPNELLLGSPWEYDVPTCGPAVAGCSREGGLWVHTVRGSMLGKQSIAHLNSHCHAPTCLSTALYACAVGTSLADCNASVGRLVCETRPVYGGSGAPGISGSRFDEAGYIALADCLWGDEALGLEAPADVDGVPLHIVKKTNATFGHYGEMSGTRTWGMARDRVQRRPRDAEAAARSIPYPHGTPTVPKPRSRRAQRRAFAGRRVNSSLRRARRRRLLKA